MLQRVRTAFVVALLTLGVAGCSSDTGGDGAHKPEKGSEDAIRAALGCKKLPEGQQQIGDAVAYDCTDEDRDEVPVYLYAFKDESSQQEWMDYIKESRASDDPPRGIAELGTWVVDTDSKAAIKIAEEQGADVVFPGND